MLSLDTFLNSESLSNFYNVLATDKKDGKKHVMAMEAKNYPIFMTMFHTETANRHVVGLGRDRLEGKVNNATTDEINFRISQFMHL